ncbi:MULTISPECIES: hypothetical protein [unclassified Streptomyces]|uniref:hypothetical protein n=1 Tax=unclassified Streptomyces TaxID=2593676 RepID=UPI0009C9DB60|nr:MULTISPECIES: hypothetical protein [unclassified Streptomyces]ONI52956.1 hypothetical protein STIB_23010 [Streptomyces sp. IB2014 011-1]
MNAPRTKILAAAAAVALLAGGGALALSLRGGDEPAPQTSFCWASLTREDVSALTVEPRERYTSRETAVTTSRLSYCDVDGEFTLSLESLHSAESVWGTADEVAAASPVRAPIPGAPGWVNRRYAGVLLPTDCADALAKPAPYLQIQATNDQEDTWRDGALQKRMATVLTTAADRLTGTLGCSGPTPATPPGTAPPVLEREELDPARACGIEGFAPLKPSAVAGFNHPPAPSSTG